MVAVRIVDVVNVGSVGVDYIVPFSIITSVKYEIKGDVGMSNNWLACDNIVVRTAELSIYYFYHTLPPIVCN